MAKQALSASITVTGLRETLAALRKMPDDAKSELKDTSFELAQALAKALRSAARGQGGQAALMAGTVTTGSNTGVDSDLPVVQAGGSGRVGRHGAPAYGLLFGSEFGVGPTFRSGWYGKSRYRGSPGRQYKPRNSSGYWFFPTVKAMGDDIAEKWSEAAERVIAAFGED